MSPSTAAASVIATVPVPTRPTGSYASPLSGQYADKPALPEEKAADGKSFVNPPRDDGRELSEAYDTFTAPLDNGIRGGFDVHIYFDSTDPEQTTYAEQLWQRIRREFPELRIYKIWPMPIGPHPQAMFEVNLHTPAQFGAFVTWLAIWRGPLSALIHPNTLAPSAPGGDGQHEDEEDEGRRALRDHTERALWFGERLDLKTEIFHMMTEAAEKKKADAQADKAE